MVKGSVFLSAGFVVLGLLLASLFVLAVHRAYARPRATLLAAAGTAAWLAFTGAAAASGRLGFETRPPTMMLLIALTLTLTVALGVSRVGGRLAAGVPLVALVAVQSFRLPLELLMHRAYAEGLMPVQMSYSGRNFDIVTGILAIACAALLAAGKLPRWGVQAWNVIGFGLLLNILTVAFLSAPTPIRVFHDEPANVWITAFPWVWLPAVMVPMALLGHVVVFRALRAQHAAEAPKASAACSAVLA